MDYQLPKGTHDIIGEEARLFDEAQGLMKQLATSYGYQPVYTPIFEATELFLRSVGEGSDIVRKEMYTFMDKGNRSLTLRPEMTAGALRAIVSAKLDKTAELPIKLFYAGPSFRYERPQLGRYRQFHQFGIEAVGISSPFSDVEAIMLGYRILQTLGYKHLVIKLNSLGDIASRDAYRTALKEYFAPKIDTMCPDCHDRLQLNPLRILDCKVPADQAIAANALKLADFLSPEAKQYYEEVKKHLEAYEIPFTEDPQLVRGLDYYSHVVFEYHLSDEKGKSYGALGAGGHYENLLSELGGAQLPGVGFAMGLERIVATLQELKLAPDYSRYIEAYVLPLSKEEVPYAFAIATLLRQAGLPTDMSYEGKGIKQLIKKATRLKARYALIVGEEERKHETIAVKDLDSETQEVVPLKELVAFFQHKYSHHHDQCSCEEGSCACGDDHECQCEEGTCSCDDHECQCEDGTCSCADDQCSCHDHEGE